MRLIRAFDSCAMFHPAASDFPSVEWTAVPPTSAAHLWIKHEPRNQPQLLLDEDDRKSQLGGGERRIFCGTEGCRRIDDRLRVRAQVAGFSR